MRCRAPKSARCRSGRARGYWPRKCSRHTAEDCAARKAACAGVLCRQAGKGSELSQATRRELQSCYQEAATSKRVPLRSVSRAWRRASQSTHFQIFVLVLGVASDVPPSVQPAKGRVQLLADRRRKPKSVPVVAWPWFGRRSELVYPAQSGCSRAAKTAKADENNQRNAALRLTKLALARHPALPRAWPPLQ